jgi:hypothetical protein
MIFAIYTKLVTPSTKTYIILFLSFTEGECDEKSICFVFVSVFRGGMFYYIELQI